MRDQGVRSNPTARSKQIRCCDKSLPVKIEHHESCSERDGDGRQFCTGHVGDQIADHRAAFADHRAGNPLERLAQTTDFVVNHRGEPGLFLPDQGSHADVTRKYLDSVEVGNAIDVDHDARSSGPLHKQRDQALTSREHASIGGMLTQQSSGLVHAIRPGIAERNRRQPLAPRRSIFHHSRRVKVCASQKD
jgi:hypothetical protein